MRLAWPARMSRPARISQLSGHRERVRTLSLSLAKIYLNGNATDVSLLLIGHVASISLLDFRSRSIPAPDTDDALTHRRAELAGT